MVHLAKINLLTKLTVDDKITTNFVVDITANYKELEKLTSVIFIKLERLEVII